MRQTLLSELRRATTVGLLVLVAGCGIDGALGHNQGRVRLVLTGDAIGNADLHAPQAISSAESISGDDDDRGRTLGAFKSAHVTLSSILVRTLDGVLVDLDADLPVAVDVVKIEGGRSIVLPDGILPVGDYDQVVLVITAVRGVTADGTAITIEPPGGGWTAVIPICPLEVVEGATDTVGIAINVRSSFLFERSRWSFQPRFRSMARDCDGAAGT